MNTKTSVVFSIIAIAAAVLLFAAGPVVTTHQAHAYWGGWGGWGGWGLYPAWGWGWGGCSGNDCGWGSAW